MKKAKMFFAVFMVAVVALSLVACNNNDTTTTTTGSVNSKETSTEAESTATTSAAAETTTQLEPKETKPVILVVSFGTSYNDNRELTIGAIEADIASAFPQYEVRRAFTSQIIIDILKERDSIETDNVKAALDRLVADGVKEVIIQPTHVMNGFEYDDVVEEAKEYKDKFDSLKFGKQLLANEADYKAVVDALVSSMAEKDDGETAFVFVGHGTEHPSNATYARLQSYFREAEKSNFFIGTVEAEPDYNAVLEGLKETDYKKIVLAPLMVVAGDHANNDICGDEEDAWKSMLTAEQYEVTPHVTGLGQYEDIRKIYIAHVQKAIDTPAIVGPVKGDALKPGTYEGVEVSSSSSMFRIVNCVLTVDEGGSMSAVLTLSGKGYGKLFMGTGKDAETAEESEFIPFVEDAEGKYTYTVPVEALDHPIECAAFSIKKESWYDRIIQFSADTLPLEAFK